MRIPLPEAELRALLHLRLVDGIGDRGVGELVRAFGSARAALDADPRRFAAVAGRSGGGRGGGGGGDIPSRVDACLRVVESLRLDVRARGWPGYPEPLLHLHDPPPVLFLRGDPSLLERRAVAVVGTRGSTPYGRRTAARIARSLVRSGAVVVSGLAAGIDGVAHGAALDAGGGTVAVLGTGPDVAYPASNRSLFRRIAREGLLVTEFLPGERGRRHHFPRRNRIIAALASAVVVVEAPARSGALITVDHALDLGREIFAVPGPIDREASAGTNAMIRDGAHVVVHPGGVAETLGWSEEEDAVGGTDGTAVETRGPPPEALGPDARKIGEALACEPRHVDEIARRAGVGMPRALAALLDLEVAGHALRTDEGRYARGDVPGGLFGPSPSDAGAEVRADAPGEVGEAPAGEGSGAPEGEAA